MIKTVTNRTHAALCSEPHDCVGPTQLEMTVTAMVIESTLPTIFRQISTELKQALHSMSSGHSGWLSEPDATAEDPERMLVEWFRHYHSNQSPLTTEPPHSLLIRTAAYLTARAVEQGKTVRSTADL